MSLGAWPGCPLDPPLLRGEQNTAESDRRHFRTDCPTTANSESKHGWRLIQARNTVVKYSASGACMDREQIVD